MIIIFLLVSDTKKKTQLQVEALEGTLTEEPTEYPTLDGALLIDWSAAAVLPIINEKGTEVPFSSLFVKNVTTAVVFIRHFG